MRFVLFAVVFPLQFPLLNFSTRDRHNTRSQPFETFERRFLFSSFLSLQFDTVASCWRLFNSFHLKAHQARATPTIINKILSSESQIERKYWNTPDIPHATEVKITKMNPSKAKTLATASTDLSRTLTSQSVANPKWFSSTDLFRTFRERLSQIDRQLLPKKSACQIVNNC